MLQRLTSLAIALAVSANAGAAPKERGAERPVAKVVAKKLSGPKKGDLERLRKALESGNEASALQALQEIAGFGSDGAAAAPLIETLLARGANLSVLSVALEAAGSVAQPSSSAHVAPYLQHRRPELRQGAARTLAKTGGPVAVTALRSGLHSADPSVRASSAAGLGDLGASEAVDELFAVLNHGTVEAARSVAVLCTPTQCDRFMELVGKVKFETLQSGFVPLLLRPASSLPDPNKLRYVDRLRRLATKSAGETLKSVLNQLPKDQSPALRVALESALRGRPIAEGDQ